MSEVELGEILDDQFPLIVIFPANSYQLKSVPSSAKLNLKSPGPDRERSKTSSIFSFGGINNNNNNTQAAESSSTSTGSSAECINLHLVHRPLAEKLEPINATKQDEDHWYFIFKNRQNGPIAKQNLLNLLGDPKSGVTKETPVWNRAYLQDWSPLKDAMLLDLLEEVVGEQAGPNQETTTARRRTKILKEIVETERTYVGLLGLLVETFVDPLRPATDSDSILTDEEHNILFSNVEVIHATNQKFQAELEERLRTKWFTDPHCCIGDIFTAFVPFFRMYSQYVNNHEKASELLRKLQERSKFAKFSEDALASKKRYSSLADLLILPIQRVPRYQLLLAEFVKNTEKTHRDYASLQAALEAVIKVASQINEAVRAQKQAEYMRSLEGQFDEDPKFVAPDRRFIHQAKMTKRCRRKDVEYEFFLFNNLLVYADRTGGRFHIHRQIPVDGAFRGQEVAEGDGIPPFAFEIHNSYHSFLVYTDTQEEKNVWLGHLAQCEQGYKKSLLGTKDDPAFARPVWKPDATAKECRWCSSKFTVFHRRHHCRACGSLVCGNCSNKKHRLTHKPDASAKEERVCFKCFDDLTTHNFQSIQIRNTNEPVFIEEDIDDDDDEEESIMTRPTTPPPAPPPRPPPVS